MQPVTGGSPFQGPPPLGATCENGVCTAEYRGHTLRADFYETADGSYSRYAGTPFFGFDEPYPEAGTARYEGVATLRRTTGRNQTVDEVGTATLNADFGASTISGRVEGANGSPVRLTLNDASLRTDDPVADFEASSIRPSPSGLSPVTCQAGVTCDWGYWFGEFGHEETVGALFDAYYNGEPVLSGALVGAQTESTMAPEPEPITPATDWPEWPVKDMAASRSLTGSTQLAMTPQQIGAAITAVNDIRYRTDPTSHHPCLGGNVWPAAAEFCVGGDELRAVMERRGIPLVQTRVIYDLEPNPYGSYDAYTAYGGLLKYGYFSVHAQHYFFSQQGEETGIVSGSDDRASYLLAKPRFEDADHWPGPVATGHWAGVMLGADQTVIDTWQGSTDLGILGDPNYIIQGDADIRVHLNPGHRLDDRKVDVAFTNIVGINSGTRYPDLNWRVWMGEDRSLISDFRADSRYYCPGGNDCYLPQGGTIAMQFAGPNHDEVLGGFSITNIEGTFGAQRQ